MAIIERENTLLMYRGLLEKKICHQTIHKLTM